MNVRFENNPVNDGQPTSIFFITEDDVVAVANAQTTATNTTNPTNTNELIEVVDRRIQVFPKERSKIEYVPFSSMVLIVIFVIALIVINSMYGQSLIRYINKPPPSNNGGTTPFYNGTIPTPLACGQPAIAPNPIDESVDLKRNKRIINGRNAIPHSWPWMVSLRRKYLLGHFCDGFLIFPSYVLTAAHCVEKITSDNIVVITGLDELEPEYIDSSQVYDVAKIYANEMYDSVNIEYDVAVIKLARPVQLSKNVALVCLPEYEKSVNDVLDKKVVLAGWGRIDSGTSNILASRLQETTLEILNSESLCVNPNYDPDIIYCAIDPNNGVSNACNGDSGSPIFIQRNNIWYAYGIVSYITGRSSGDTNICDTKQPSYFTKLPLYINWIASKISLG